jgi:spore coat polysaccharide biosynthesis protein SpsF
MTQTLVVVQARMASSRLPGKVLKPIAGAPMIVRQLERISRSQRTDEIVVATTDDPSDDPLAHTVESAGFQVYRGHTSNVLSRFVSLAQLKAPAAVVRITGDSPLVSPHLIDRMVAHFYATEPDYLSNAVIPRFPDGLDIEVIARHALIRAAELATTFEELEHVTLGIYLRPQEFTIQHFNGDIDFSSWRWTVDTEDDYSFVSSLFSTLYSMDPEFEWTDAIAYLLRNPNQIRTDRLEPRNSKTREIRLE